MIIGRFPIWSLQLGAVPFLLGSWLTVELDIGLSKLATPVAVAPGGIIGPSWIFVLFYIDYYYNEMLISNDLFNDMTSSEPASSDYYDI